jgi:hypothetical protein
MKNSRENTVSFEESHSQSGYVVGALYKISYIDCESDETDVYMCCDAHGDSLVMVNLRHGTSYNSHDEELNRVEFRQVHGRVCVCG